MSKIFPMRFIFAKKNLHIPSSWVNLRRVEMDHIDLSIIIIITYSYYLKSIEISLSLLWSLFDIVRGDWLDDVTKCYWRMVEFWNWFNHWKCYTDYFFLWMFGLLRRLLIPAFFLITASVSKSLIWNPPYDCLSYRRSIDHIGLNSDNIK